MSLPINLASIFHVSIHLINKYYICLLCVGHCAGLWEQNYKKINRTHALLKLMG